MSIRPGENSSLFFFLSIYLRLTRSESIDHNRAGLDLQTSICVGSSD